MSLNRRQLGIYLVALAVLTASIVYLTKYTGFAHEFSEVLTYTRVIYIGLLIMVLLKLLHFLVLSDLIEAKKKVLLTTITLLTVFCVLEAIFMFIPKSHGAGGKDCLAGRLWFSKYWKVNDLGYRDKAPNLTAATEEIKIMIIGDSFVAGHGIKDPANRFSNLLEQMLSKNHRVYNLGLNGADTQTEYNKLVQFPVKPNLIILVHHPNDIERVPRPTANVHPAFLDQSMSLAALGPEISNEHFVNSSYLINYFFWKFNPINALDEELSIADQKYFESEAGQNQDLSAYLNKSMFTQHLQNIHQFVLLSREESIPLAVVLFPETWDETIEFSETFANKPIQAFLKREGIPVLDLYSIVKAIPVKDRIINNNDAHPSELMHQRVAQSLHEFLVQSNLIGGN